MSEYKSKLQDDELDFLFDAILSLENREECYRFFEDLCTITEMKALGQRMQVVKMLKQGKTYNDIAHLTGASTATISRVNRALNYGSEGYNLVLSRINWKEEGNTETSKEKEEA